MLNRETLTRSIVAILSIVISFFVVEVCLREMTPTEYFLDGRTDSYWKSFKASAIKLNLKEADIVPDHALGWRMKPFFESVGVHHNSRGFRGKREYISRPGRSRILVIGDSFTYGLGVPDDLTFPAYVEKMTGVEAVNSGVNGYGVDQALLMWEIEGQQLHPTHVILGYFVDDFFRNELSFRDGPKPHFMFDSAMQQYVLKIPVEADANSFKLSSWNMLKESIRIFQAIGWLERRIRLKTGFIDEERMERAALLNEYILRRLQSSVSQSGASLMIVVIGHSYDGNSEHLWIEKSIINTCRSNGMECLNLAAAARGEANQKLLYGQNGHFSVQGTLWVAQKIAAVLKLERNNTQP